MAWTSQHKVNTNKFGTLNTFWKQASQTELVNGFDQNDDRFSEGSIIFHFETGLSKNIDFLSVNFFALSHAGNVSIPMTLNEVSGFLCRLMVIRNIGSAKFDRLIDPVYPNFSAPLHSTTATVLAAIGAPYDWSGDEILFEKFFDDATTQQGEVKLPKLIFDQNETATVILTPCYRNNLTFENLIEPAGGGPQFQYPLFGNFLGSRNGTTPATIKYQTVVRSMTVQGCMK